MEDINDLVKKCQKKETKAFDDLYKRYSPLIYGICLRYLKNEEEAKDVMQDCFVKIIENIKRYRFDGSFEGWCRRLTVNCILDSLRKKQQNFEVQYYDNTAYSAITEDDGQSLDILQKLSVEKLLSLVNSLPDRSRVVFNLVAVDGVKGKEILKLLGIEESTVRSIYKKAKDSLCKKMKEESYERF